MFIVSLAIANSVPPFQTTGGEAGKLDIEFPKVDIFPYGEDIELHFHIFNSTGKLVSNSSFSQVNVNVCQIHIYDEFNNVYDKPKLN